MEYLNKTIKELHDDLVNKKTTFSELYLQIANAIKANEDSNFILYWNKEDMMKKAKELDSKPIEKDNLLYGIPYFAKDNFSTKDIPTTAATTLLAGFIPLYDATVIEILEKAKAVMIGKVNLDELAMGGTGLLSGFGAVKNPRDPKRMVGGSSSGSAYAVTQGIVPFALGSDTGDSIRKPASYNGIVGYKPTYGAISRYGMMPYSPSLDHAGILSQTLEDAALVADVLVQTDNRDFTTTKIDEKDFLANLKNFDKSKKIGYIKVVHDFLPTDIKTKYEDLYSQMKKDGFNVQPIKFRKDLLDALASVYMMISFSEAVSTNANLDGINFGNRVDGDSWEEVMKNTRTKHFGPVVKRRFIIGSLNLKKENQHIFLLKAKKVRRLICEAVDKAFEQVDFLITPPSIDIAPLIDNAKEFDQNKSDSEFIEDILTLGNFAGIPSITIPFVEKQNLPIGININGKAKDDRGVFQAAKMLETEVKKIDKVVK